MKKLSGKDEENQAYFHFDNMYMENPQHHESLILYQIGDLSCKKGYTVKEHMQHCYEISYVVSGKGEFHMDNKCYEIEEGDIVLNVPGETHYIRTNDEQPLRYYYAGFNFDISNENSQSFVHIKKMFDQTHYPVVKSKLQIDMPFVSIFNELVHLNSYSTVMIGMYLRQLIIIAYRCFHESWEAGYKPEQKEASATSMVYEVINYIDVHLQKIKELSQIADELHYSYSYMSNTFSKEIGLTIQEYYNRKRFEKAVQWLQEGDMNITAIAEKLNYHSIHTFSKAFRKNFGISPSEYQLMSKAAAINSNKEQ